MEPHILTALPSPVRRSKVSSSLDQSLSDSLNRTPGTGIASRGGKNKSSLSNSQNPMGWSAEMTPRSALSRDVMSTKLSFQEGTTPSTNTMGGSLPPHHCSSYLTQEVLLFNCSSLLKYLALDSYKVNP